MSQIEIVPQTNGSQIVYKYGVRLIPESCADLHESDQVFLTKMVRYTHSMNDVSVDRVSIHSADLLRLVHMVAHSQCEQKPIAPLDKG